MKIENALPKFETLTVAFDVDHKTCHLNVSADD